MVRKISMWSLIFMFSIASVFSFAGTGEASFEASVDTVILVDGETGRILHQQNVDNPMPPASMTKMMSEYLILEAINNGDISWEDTVPINDYLAELSHDRSLSNVPLNVDEEYSVLDLYESVAIYSANASAMALAELIAGSEGEFVKMMNAKGEELGLGTLLRDAGEEYGMDNLAEIFEAELGDFQFVNSTGLPNRLLEGNHPEGTDETEDNYMSAKAAATLGYHLVNDYPEVLETAGIAEKTFREGTADEIVMQNWNWMLEGTQYSDLDYEYVGGLKTGFTESAGYTFTGTAEKEGQSLISVVMKADSESHRFNETERLMEWGFDNFSIQEVFPENMTLDGYESLPVTKGQKDQVEIVSTEAVSLLTHKDDEEAYSYTVELDEEQLNEDGELEAPIEEGQVVGQLVINYNGEQEEEYLFGEELEARTVDIVATEEVERSGWFTLMFKGIGDFFSGLWTSVIDTVKGWL
ncbi:D-alanyl-D-alanine carboxypeptidase family protein [Salipaludibacillus sp. CF4.18]|uniref:D-alanyl-D-alanine carboxypeptidase family protein n=1 Tax=Salipaludibacillus sp. CF4.18 TaxID=3373081 RepID=UPI003EE81734